MYCVDTATLKVWLYVKFVTRVLLHCFVSRLVPVTVDISQLSLSLVLQENLHETKYGL